MADETTIQIFNTVAWAATATAKPSVASKGSNTTFSGSWAAIAV